MKTVIGESSCRPALFVLHSLRRCGRSTGTVRPSSVQLGLRTRTTGIYGIVVSIQSPRSSSTPVLSISSSQYLVIVGPIYSRGFHFVQQQQQ